MIDISSTSISKLIVHRVGNKLRDEGVLLSPEEAVRTSTVDDLLLKNYLASVVRHGEVYEFYHESELSLNVVFHFAALIFQDSTTLSSNSQNIAKHLYSASVHPNIGGGELLVILFEDVRIDGRGQQALGLFRIEGKNDYIDIADNNGALQIVERLGISLEKVQKGAIALSKGKQVYVVDSLSQKTKYWIENFLKAVPSETPKVRAKAVGSFVKAISNKVANPTEAVEFGQRLHASLTGSEGVTLGEIRNLSTSYLSEQDVDGILTGISSKVGLDMKDSLAIDSRELSRYTRDAVTKARIAEGIHVVVSSREAHIKAVDVKKTRSGLRATVDIDLKGE